MYDLLDGNDELKTLPHSTYKVKKKGEERQNYQKWRGYQIEVSTLIDVYQEPRKFI
jgi:hypothetical protein